MKLISQAEPVPRGWYAAPVGWIDRHLNGQFGVAIRSALAQERRVWLYAGAGIVRESDPLKEWDETALKFKPMLNALGLE
jgi:menaquinone-specific isochorismate synthase